MSKAAQRNFTSASLGAAVGALDGIAASADLNAGRAWTSTGVGVSGMPVIGWGWAPAVQVGAVAAGGSLWALGHDSGRGPTLMGLGLFVRAATLTLAQRRQTPPAAVQGYFRNGYSAPSWRPAQRRRTAKGMGAEIVRGTHRGIGVQANATIAG